MLAAVGADDLMRAVAFSKTVADAVLEAELYVIPECRYLTPIEKPTPTAELLRARLRH